MVQLSAVKAHNAALKSLAPSLVAVFVGGTSGISLSTALALARHTVSPRIYLVGRNQSAADAVISDMKSINPSAEPRFIKADVSLLKNVDTVCAEISAQEKRLNLLFMTPGVGYQSSRVETADGIDRKVELHYYTRMRFIDRLLPLLAAARSDPDPKNRLSRVVSVLDPYGGVRMPGSSPALDYNDLSLRNTWGVGKCVTHTTSMTSFYLEGLARKYPQTSFVHAYPSTVPTGGIQSLPLSKLIVKLAGPFMVPLEESGERHLYTATHPAFAPRADANTPAGDGALLGSDGTKASGSYWASWDNVVFAENKKLNAIRNTGAVEKVTRHTEEVFRRVCDEGGRYP